MLCFFYLPPHLRLADEKKPNFYLLFTLNFLLPVIGAIGTMLAILLPLHTPKAKQNVTWDLIDNIDLPDDPGEFSLYQYSSGSMYSILLHHHDAYSRQQVVQAAIHLPPRLAIPVLKIAISDNSDEVRLLAFSQLDKIETQINKTILASETRFEKAPNYKDASIIAEQYWELCYLSIASHAARQLYLEKAKAFLLESERLKPSVSAKFLLGRVLLAMGSSREALAAFQQCIAMNIELKQVAPYMAEAAFENGHYEQMKHYLNYIPDDKSDKFSRIKAYWL